MSKFGNFSAYPSRSVAGAEAALLTAWASLNRFHSDLVLVGGLAIKYLTRPIPGLLPGPVTLDVDLGVSLAAEGGQYGSIADDLAGQGFKRDGRGRFVREFEAMPVFIDFLTERPAAPSGSAMVEGIAADVFPGVARALAAKEIIGVTGRDFYGAVQNARIPVSGIGPLLVLKLNAFGSRQQAKDAYDILLGVSQFKDGPEAAVAAFRAELSARNPGYARAEAVLREHFCEAGQSGPLRAAAFVLEGLPSTDEAQMRRLQIAQQMVTAGRALSA